jgi:hypothetical protein
MRYPEHSRVRQGLGQEPQQAKKPPAFRKGKQVVCAIWVPSGIACKVTILVLTTIILTFLHQWC